MNSRSTHDEFFKLLFREKENAVSYFQNTFPSALLAKMDFTTLQLEDGTFVDERLKEKFSDILYSATIQGKTGYIYILLDYKSQINTQHCNCGSSSGKKTVDKLKKVLENSEIRGAKEIMATFAEELIQEGFVKGEKVGLRKGKKLAELRVERRAKRADRKRKLRTAIRLKKEGSELAFIAKIAELDVKYLRAFFQKIDYL